MRTALFYIVALSMLGVYALTGCVSPPPVLPSQIPVGCLISTSSAPTWGPNLLKAAKVAEEDINGLGGIDGKRIVLVTEDEGATAASALYAAHKLVEDKKVQVIVGGTTSDVVMGIGSYASSKGVVLVSPSATSSLLGKQGWSGWVFRVSPSDSLQGGVVAKLIKDMGYKHVAMLVQDSVYGRGIEEVTREFLKGRAEIVASVKYSLDKQSYLTELNVVKDKNPDCVLHVGHYDDGAVIYEQALKRGMDNIPWIAVDGVYDMPLDKYTEAAKFMEKVATGTVPLPDTESDSYKKFADRYKALYGFTPTVYCDTTYDSVNLVAAALKKAGVYQGSAIRDALNTVGRDYQGTSGTITFVGSGERQAGIYGLWKVEMQGTQYRFKIIGQPVHFMRAGL